MTAALKPKYAVAWGRAVPCGGLADRLATATGFIPKGGLKLAMALFVVASPNVVIDEIATSGRCISLAESPDARVAQPKEIAPGQAPLFSFRLYEGQSRQRFANSDLMLDDAGH